MKIQQLLSVGLCGLACVVSGAAHAQTAVGVNRICSVRPAAALIAQSLASKIKAAVDAGAAEGKRSLSSVRVGFSPPKTRPTITKIDVTKGVGVSVNLTAASDKITLQGAPSAETLYQTCDPGELMFTANVSYRDLSKTPAVPVSIRQTIKVVLQGQYL